MWMFHISFLSPRCRRWCSLFEWLSSRISFRIFFGFAFLQFETISELKVIYRFIRTKLFAEQMDISQRHHINKKVLRRIQPFVSLYSVFFVQHFYTFPLCNNINCLIRFIATFYVQPMKRFSTPRTSSLAHCMWLTRFLFCLFLAKFRLFSNRVRNELYSEKKDKRDHADGRMDLCVAKAIASYWQRASQGAKR